MSASVDFLFGDGGNEGGVEKSLSVLELDDCSGKLYVLSRYNGSILSLTVSDGEKCWAGQLTQSQLKLLAKETKLDLQQYISETMRALTRKGLGDLTFLYSTIPSDTRGGTLELVWKKHLITDNIKFQLGSIRLSPEPARLSHSLLLEFAVSKLCEQESQISELQTEQTRLVAERQGFLSRLNEHANIKEDLEKELYGKFKVALNDKKAKIRRLMEQLGHLSQQVKAQQQNSLSSIDPVEDARRHSYDSETDDDIDRSKSPSGSSTEHQSPPTVRVVERKMESLLGDLQSHKGLSPPPVKRRKRQGDTHKVRSQSVEIPHPPVLSRTSETKGHVQTVATETKSNASLESDELLDLL